MPNSYTVETELVCAAPIKFDEILVQNLLSKNHVLLKGAALIKVRPLIPFLRYVPFWQRNNLFQDRVLVEAAYNANMPFKWNATRIQVLPNQNAGVRPNSGGPTVTTVTTTSTLNAHAFTNAPPMSHPPPPRLGQPQARNEAAFGGGGGGGSMREHRNSESNSNSMRMRNNSPPREMKRMNSSNDHRRRDDRGSNRYVWEKLREITIR